MARLTKKDMAELRDFCALDCDYSDAKEIVYDTASEVLEDNGFEDTGVDRYDILDCDGALMPLDVFVEQFYEKIAEKILNVVETQGK